MKSYPNIERISGRLVGYDKDGNSWRIFGRCGNWNAKANIGNGQLIMFDRLSEISKELATIGNGDTLSSRDGNNV